MARPNIDLDALQSGEEGWDAAAKDMFRGILVNPYPVPEFANAGALPAASSYARCLATTADNNKLWFSNGTIWKEIAFV